MICLWGFTIFVNTWFGFGTDIYAGVLLTFVIDLFMFLSQGILTPVCYCFLKVISISLSILMRCFNTLERL